MSVVPVMMDCPKCGGDGNIYLYMPLNHCQNYFRIKDICDRCGGSGRVIQNESVIL